jgi:vanillate O-demethylase monooxygenase subunit
MFAPAGSGAEKGNIAGARQYRNCQFMTPETRRTTHFFWNYLHNFDLDDPNIALSLCNSLREGFMEDKAIIEAQQRLFDREPETQLLAIAADAALAHFRRVFGQRLAPSAARWPRPPDSAQPATGGSSFLSWSGSTGFCR